MGKKEVEKHKSKKAVKSAPVSKQKKNVSQEIPTLEELPTEHEFISQMTFDFGSEELQPSLHFIDENLHDRDELSLFESLLA